MPAGPPFRRLKGIKGRGKRNSFIIPAAARHRRGRNHCTLHALPLHRGEALECAAIAGTRTGESSVTVNLV